ncbi:MAG: ATP synthase F1 subunit delta [Bacteroidales bacterium]|nr:ATP synthase F1 subunit delta [Bacteroidales bacterium]
MNNYRININYAKALFILAGDLGMQDAVAEDMRLVGKVCAENHVLNVFFSNPTVKESKKQAVVEALFRGKVSEPAMVFLAFVVRRNRTVNLRGISNAYLDIYRESRGIVKADFVTAIEVNAETEQTVRDMVSRHTGKHVELNATVDDRMLGGFTMSFDNNMYDARLRTKIQKLRKEYSKNIYESKL